MLLVNIKISVAKQTPSHARIDPVCTQGACDCVADALKDDSFVHVQSADDPVQSLAFSGAEVAEFVCFRVSEKKLVALGGSGSSLEPGFKLRVKAGAHWYLSSRRHRFEYCVDVSANLDCPAIFFARHIADAQLQQFSESCTRQSREVAKHQVVCRRFGCDNSCADFSELLCSERKTSGAVEVSARHHRTAQFGGGRSDRSQQADDDRPFVYDRRCPVAARSPNLTQFAHMFGLDGFDRRLAENRLKIIDDCLVFRDRFWSRTFPNQLEPSVPRIQETLGRRTEKSGHWKKRSYLRVQLIERRIPSERLEPTFGERDSVGIHQVRKPVEVDVGQVEFDRERGFDVLPHLPDLICCSARQFPARNRERRFRFSDSRIPSVIVSTPDFRKGVIQTRQYNQPSSQHGSTHELVVQYEDGRSGTFPRDSAWCAPAPRLLEFLSPLRGERCSFLCSLGFVDSAEGYTDMSTPAERASDIFRDANLKYVPLPRSFKRKVSRATHAVGALRNRSVPAASRIVAHVSQAAGVECSNRVQHYAGQPVTYFTEGPK